MEPLQEIDGFALERIAHPLDADVVQQFVHQLGEVLRTTVHNVQVVLVLITLLKGVLINVSGVLISWMTCEKKFIFSWNISSSLAF